MNQPYARVYQPYATLTLASALREMFGVQLYKNNARALLSRILSILNLDWLQHARSVRGVYESTIKYGFLFFLQICFLWNRLSVAPLFLWLYNICMSFSFSLLLVNNFALLFVTNGCH